MVFQAQQANKEKHISHWLPSLLLSNQSFCFVAKYMYKKPLVRFCVFKR